MSFKASLRVINPEGGRPSPAQVSAVAVRLSALGFDVVYVGRMAVSIEGDAERFEGVLGVPPPGPNGYSLPVHPDDAMLRSGVDRVEAYPRIEAL